MRRSILALAILGALVPGLCWGQSMPQVPNGAGGFLSGLYFGFIPSAANWNTWFQAKQDWPMQPLTVTGLPTCTSALFGQWYIATDTTSPTYNGALTGGGAVKVPVLCNGVSWTSH
jgi:hypothetical protein